MNRAVEIINSLRAGMASLLGENNEKRVNSLRMFNFEKNRVSLRMELIDNHNISHPMGMIDVVEYPTGKERKASCSCHLTELATGKTEKLILKLNNQDEQTFECAKVFNFFRKVLDIPDIQATAGLGSSEPAQLSKETEHIVQNSDLLSPSDGQLPDHSRGVQ